MTSRVRFSIGNARTFRDSEQFVHALGHYVAVLGSLPPERRASFESEFVECVVHAAGTAKDQNAEILSKLAQSCMHIFPQNIDVIVTVSNALYHSGHLREAQLMMLTVSKGEPFPNIACGYARIALANISSAMFHSWHIRMINDLNRNTLYEKSIANNVRENDRVLEVGSGTGLLSVFASRITAKVVGVEESKTLFDISQEVLKKNGSCAEIINCHSNEYQGLQPTKPCEPSQLFNVVISEIMDCCGFGEGVLSTMQDIHQRLASSDAIFIPSQLSVFATVVSSPSIFKLHRCNNVLSEYHNCSSKDHPYWCADLSEFPDVELLSERTELISVKLDNYNDVSMERANLSSAIKISKEGTAHCMVVNFRALLADGIVLDSRAENSSWDHGIFPLPEELDVDRSSSVTLDYSLVDSKLNISCREAVELHRIRIVEQPVFTLNMDAVSIQRHWLENTSSMNWRSSLPSCIYKLRTIPMDDDMFIKNREDSEQIMRDFDVRNEWDYVTALDSSQTVEACDAIVWDPINSDGTLNESVIGDVLNIVITRGKAEIYRPVHYLPDRFVCRGMLIQSAKLSKLSRPDHSAHCGVELASSMEDCHLFEYREIKLDSFPHQSRSDAFNVLELDIGSITEAASNSAVIFASEVIEVLVSCSGIVDGMVYWWESAVFTNKQLLVAAFVFKKQINVKKNDIVKICVDYYNHHLLASLVDS